MKTNNNNNAGRADAALAILAAVAAILARDAVCPAAVAALAAFCALGGYAVWKWYIAPEDPTPPEKAFSVFEALAAGAFLAPIYALAGIVVAACLAFSPDFRRELFA